MSFPRYPEYKESGVEWLREVPGHWELAKLKHLARFAGGGTPSRDNPSFWGGSIPWVSPKDMKVARIETAEECITEEGLAGSSTGLIPPGRVLMVVRSGILKHTIPVAINGVEVALNQDMKALDFSDGACSAEFFFSWVQGLNDFLLLEWAKQGATVESIEHTYLSETLIPLPSAPEQARIAAFLDRETARIDALVAEQQKLIALLKEKRQALISHAVTKGLDPEVPMKDSGVAWLGEVPAHWTVRPLKYAAHVGNGSTPNRDNPHYWLGGVYPWLNSSVANQDQVTEAEQFVTPLALQECHLPIIKPPAILVGITGQGRTRGMATTLMMEATINQHLAFVKPIKTSLDVRFLRRLFDMAYPHLRTESEEGGSTKGAITCDQISRLKIPMPNVDEQAAIANFLDHEAAKLSDLLIEAETAITLLHERRTALISAAVTGKIDVRHFATDTTPEPA